MFYYSDSYPALKLLEDRHPLIVMEMLKVSKGIRMRTWPETHKFNGSWKVFGLYHDSRKMEKFCELCPVTTSTIESMGKVTMAGFSKMAPKTDILPHVDDVVTTKRIHLALHVPYGDCGFEVDGVQTKWEEGKAFVFDPRKIHRAWNRTTEDRVVLLLDFEDFS